MSRNGKIARLPFALREELNQRLRNGEQGKQLVAWLNTHPAVQALLARDFRGHPLREQNLSRWKQGGYREWLLEQKALEAASQTDSTLLSPDAIAISIANSYAHLIKAQLGTGTLDQDFRVLRRANADLIALRRSKQGDSRLVLAGRLLELRHARMDSTNEVSALTALAEAVRELEGPCHPGAHRADPAQSRQIPPQFFSNRVPSAYDPCPEPRETKAAPPSAIFTRNEFPQRSKPSPLSDPLGAPQSKKVPACGAWERSLETATHGHDETRSTSAAG